MKLLTTKTEDDERGRSFTGALLAEVYASVWTQSDSGKNAKRPVLLSLACESGAAAPIVANLRAGSLADVYPVGSRPSSGYQVELLRSAGYKFEVRSTPAGSRIDAYLPEVFRHTPVAVKTDALIGFVVLPSRAATWVPAPADVERVTKHLRARDMLRDEERHRYSRLERPAEDAVAGLLPYGYYLLKFLAGRTGRPLIMDAAFGVQLLVTFAQKGFLAFGTGGFVARSGLYTETLHTHSGFAPGFAVSIGPTSLDSVLSNAVQFFLRPSNTEAR